MGVIQNAINQMLGTVGLAARLSPDYETKQELHKLGKKETAISMQQESLGPIDYEEFEEGKTIAAKQHHEILEKQAEVAQKQFELEPNKESMKKAAFARSAAGQGPLMTFKADPEEIMMEQANIEAAQKAERKLKQTKNRKSFKEALYADPDIARLGEAAKKQVYEQTKGNKAFKQEVLKKYYGKK